ncbi:MarR family transcriptional regulator [Sphingomonas sp. 28-62-20]|uniref:MarR family transcriptional regulator n=1 Tax=Sphingomonas sp. 28-62-20 TaxID=1970433 RepID=UPI0035A843CA
MDMSANIRYSEHIHWTSNMLKFEIEEGELLESLVTAISKLPEGQAIVRAREVPIGRNGRADALVDIVVGGRPMQLLVEAKRDAFPRDVRESVWQLRTNAAHLPTDGRDILPFFVARAISPGARDILREEGIGFYDLGGTLYIPAPNAFVFIDRPPPRNTRKVFESVFQGQKARVVMAVFERRHAWLSVKELAETTEVSPATASSTLTEMERREWVDVQGSGPSKLRRLRAAEDVLDAFAPCRSGWIKSAAVRIMPLPAKPQHKLMRPISPASPNSDAASFPAHFKSRSSTIWMPGRSARDGISAL